MKKALILNYHRIEDSEEPSAGLNGTFTITSNQFLQQLNILRECQVSVVLLKDLLGNRVQDNFCVALTFDDGNPSDYEMAFPILQRFGYPATFFLSSENLKCNDALMLQYRLLYQKGYGIGSHGATHKDMTRLNQKEVLHEFLDSKKFLERCLKCAVRYFAFPFGMYNTRLLRAARECGYESVFSTRFRYLHPDQNPFIIGRFSVKRSLVPGQFRKIVRSHPMTIIKYRFLSSLKFFVMKLLGSSLTQMINIRKTRYFRQ